jgi:RNA-directed DNA polymerase
MFSFKDLYDAYLRCRKSKRNTVNALKFEVNCIENIGDLETSLNDKSYKPKRSVCFLTTSPKLREVFAADFSDRVVHHLIVPILEQVYEPLFIYDSYSCRKNKGIHHAMQRAVQFSKSSKYYLQLDIRNFFYTIDKNILYQMINTQLVKDYDKKVMGTQVTLYEMLHLLHTIIFHDVTQNVLIKDKENALHNIPAHKTLFKVPKDKALPIGNLTSQFFANVYLNGFDNFCKRKLKCIKYIRYVDDFVIFDDDKDKLLRFKDEIENYLSKHLKLKLREGVILRKTSQGLDFLGYIIRPHYTLVRKRVIQNFKRKKASFLDAYQRDKGTMSKEDIQKFLAVKASFLGHLKHANSYKLKKKVGEIDEINPFDYDRT